MKKRSPSSSHKKDKFREALENYLAKMNRIKSAEQAIKKDRADTDKLKGFYSQLLSNGSAISPGDVLAHLDELKIKANDKLQHGTVHVTLEGESYRKKRAQKTAVDKHSVPVEIEAN